MTLDNNDAEPLIGKSFENTTTATQYDALDSLIAENIIKEWMSHAADIAWVAMNFLKVFASLKSVQSVIGHTEVAKLEFAMRAFSR